MTEIRAKYGLKWSLYWRLTANPGRSSRAAIKIAQGDPEGYSFDGNWDSYGECRLNFATRLSEHVGSNQTMGTAYKLGRVFIPLFVTTSILSGCKYSSVRSGHINFSPDNSNLVFVWCFDDKPCAFVAYDIEKNTVALIRNHTENSWNYPVYSADGSKIALSSYDKKTRNSQIAIDVTATQDLFAGFASTRDSLIYYFQFFK